jgi:lysophospholipase L1-like esterase
MNRITTFVLGYFFATAVCVTAWQIHRPRTLRGSAVDPTLPVMETYFGIHQAILERHQQGPVGVLFLGDSITDFWRSELSIWDDAFGKFQPSNAGISFDQVQNVLWRVNNGELKGIHPRVVVLLIGTNNFYFGHDDGKATAAGIANLLRAISLQLPETKILLVGLLPRHGTFDADVAECNAILPGLADSKHVFYLDLGSSMPPEDFADKIHPNPDGYRKMAKILAPKIKQLYGDVPPVLTSGPGRDESHAAGF